MRSTLALSLLLLLLPPLSLSEDTAAETNQTSTPPTAAKTNQTSTPSPTPAGTNQTTPSPTSAGTKQTSAPSSTAAGTKQTSAPSSTAAGTNQTSAPSAAPSNPKSLGDLQGTSDPQATGNPNSPGDSQDPKDSKSSSNPQTPKDSKSSSDLLTPSVSQLYTNSTSMPQNTSSLSTTKKPDLSGGPGTYGTTIAPLSQTLQSMVLVSTSNLPTALIPSQHQTTNEEQHSPATLPSSAAVTSPDFVSTASAMTAMRTPPGTPEETQHTSIKTLDGSLSFSTSPQPTGSSVVTGTMSAVGEATRPSTNLTPAAPQGSTLPSPIWPFGNKKVICDPAIRPSEELLILNLTEASLCTGSPPDEKLVELLCRSVKASSFNAAQDQCTLQLAPVLEGQAVAIKRIIIETKLPPKAVYELLKDKWDDLREMGVSDMQLGKEGPPEDNEDRFSLPLIITIVCMASFLLLVAALYGCCHQRISQRKDQQRLTEELQTVENGYHDNPTLEVMETSSEMQEKKVVNLNGELADSWIVPLDNLTKDDLDEEEDTHL